MRYRYIETIKSVDYIKLILIGMCIILPFIGINKGLDVTDTGYIINSYKFVYSNPDSINFAIIFTSMFGNIISKLLTLINVPTYLGLRIVASIASLCTCFIVVKFLKVYFDEKILIIGSIFTLLLARGHISILMYNNLSAFVGTIICIFLMKGIIYEKNKYIFLSGILLGINIFIRISNLVQLVILFGIIYYGVQTKNIRNMVRSIGIFLAGMLSSVITSVIFLVNIFGEKRLMSMVNIYSKEAMKSKDSHSIFDSIKINFNQGINGVFWITLLFALSIILYYIFKNNKRIIDNIRNIYFLFILIPLIFIVFKYIGLDKVIVFNKIYKLFYSVYQPFSIAVAFFSILVLTNCFFTKGSSIDENTILIIAFLLMIAMPIGSNQGFAILYQSFYIQAPLLACYIWRIISKKNVNVKEIFQNSMIILICVYLTLMLLCRNITYVYRDNSINDKYSIKNDKLRGIKTNKQRANDVEEVINSIDKYVDSNRKLITYGSIPLFSYLLDMSPFFDGFNGWIEMDQLSVESMKNSLENTKEYPLIIISNVGTNNSIWPDNQTKIIMDEIKKSDVKYELINNYICENNYERVFENDSFTVYAK